MIDLLIIAAITWALSGNRNRSKEPMSFSKDKLPQREPAPMTARMLLESVLGDDHALHTVDHWAKGANGTLQIVCTCGGLGTTPDTKENRLSLQNMKKV